MRSAPLRVDIARREGRVDGVERHLTPHEYKLLLYLLKQRGRVLTHKQILTEVSGSAAYSSQTHHFRVDMAQVRRKLERDPARPLLLLTEPGVGYPMRDTIAGPLERALTAFPRLELRGQCLEGLIPRQGRAASPLRA